VEKLDVKVKETLLTLTQVLRYHFRQKEFQLYKKARLKGIYLMFFTTDFKLLFTRISLLLFCRLKSGLFGGFLFL